MIQTWNILGAGAIGSLLAAQLQRAGLNARLLLRANSGTTGTEITLLENDGASILPVPSLALSQVTMGSIEGLFVTTKANQAVAACQQVQPWLAPQAVLILLHNGMGIYEQVCQQYPAAQVYLATTTEAAWRRADGAVVHAGSGTTWIGQPGTAQPPPWFADLADKLPRCEWTARIEENLWRKLLINSAINPLTALHQCRNGELAENAAYRAEVEALCAEFAALAHARGYLELAAQARDIAFAVITATAANQSSMLQDVLRKQPTEIEYITGYLCSEAASLGVPCPQHRALLASIRALDSTGVAP